MRSIDIVYRPNLIGLGSIDPVYRNHVIGLTRLEPHNMVTPRSHPVAWRAHRVTIHATLL